MNGWSARAALRSANGTDKNGQPLAMATTSVTSEQLKEVVENVRDKF